MLSGRPSGDEDNGLEISNDRIAAMAVKGVKIHQIQKAEAGKFHVHRLQKLVHPVHVGDGAHMLRYAFAVVNIGNLADGDHLKAGVLQFVHHGAGEGLQGVIVTVGRPDKMPRGPDEGTGDHPAHPVFFVQGQLPADFANFVKLFKGDDFFMGGDLQNRVGGRINDERPRFHMFLPQLFDDRRPACRLVSDDLAAGSPLDFPDQFVGEAFGKHLKRGIDAEPHDFPVAGHRVFPGGGLLHFRIKSQRPLRLRDPFDFPDIAQSQLRHVRHVQPVHLFGDMPEGIGAGVVKFGRIGRLADPDRIHDDQKHPFIFHR